MNAKRFLQMLLFASLPITAMALSLSQSPLLIASVEPRVMLLMSRDHELTKKAYTDYTDINADGNLDITYLDTVNYFGYFDSDKCYQYNTSKNRFEPTSAATGATKHVCSGQWSGNFLNWSTMTRFDVLRKVLYGGFRSTDTVTTSATALGETVLERAFIPPDAHAFAKVFSPPGGAAEIGKFTPFTSVSAITLCNVTNMPAGIQAGSINTVNNTETTYPPLIKVAKGAWPQWATTEILQCQWQEESAEPSPRPSTATDRLTGSSDLVARVSVCVPNVGDLDSRCKSYLTRAATPLKTVKPTGLLQQYGDADVDRRTRFGLMTGSYTKNTSGGVLRKNIGLLTNNNNNSVSSSAVCGNNNTNDEIDVCTGQFINQNSSIGIINTINRIHIAGYKAPSSITPSAVCTSGYNNTSVPFACSASNLLNETNGTCVDWGNPLSEMYHESLRYFAGKPSATPAYDTTDAGVIANLGKDVWANASDPLPANQWCAISNIIVLSTGLTSFDSAAFASDITGIDPVALTNTVGSAEGVDGSKQFIVGNVIGNPTASDNQCSAKTLPSLASASGVCPELPHMKGGYLIAGLANSSRTVDLRPEYLANRQKRWDGYNQDWVDRQPIGTYTVGLAENLPSFKIPVGNGEITLSPACRSNGSSNCSLNDLKVESYTPTQGSFLVSWEDNVAGSDNDMDSIARIKYCVGSTCPSPGANSDQMKIEISFVQSATGSGMEMGYSITGSSLDGTFYPVKIPGSGTCNPTDCSNPASNPNYNFFSLLTNPPAFRCTNFVTAVPAIDYTCPVTSMSPMPVRLPANSVNATGCKKPDGTVDINCGCPKEFTFTSTVNNNSNSTGLLKNPLWYAAKYGATASTTDLKNNITNALSPDGVPDNFFDVRNPANLYDSLAAAFDRASQPDAAAAAAATNSTSLQLESRIFQAKFSSSDWSGQLLSLRISGTTIQPPDWDAGQKINDQPPSSRVILTKGKVGSGEDGAVFNYNNFTNANKALLDKNAFNAVDNCGAERVAYLRGDAVNEGPSGTLTCTSGSKITEFRQRNTSKLGDIVSSNPLYVGRPSAGFSDVDHPGYEKFQADNANRRPVVYAGSNDGMLHGFDASLGADNLPTTDAGKELLAYVPSGVYPNLSKLTDQSYNRSHLYFVDGSVLSGDADLASPSSTRNWRTVLVGAMGAGGKGYFALDITNPGGPSTASSFTEANAASLLLWEFTDANDADVGFGFNQPPPSVSLTTIQAKQIVKMANNKWAVILGNGYNSANGKAVLYILYLNDGIDGNWDNGDFVKIVADAAGPDNGLSTPIPFDSNGDGLADTVYAGDLKGNLWKFLVGPNDEDSSVTAVSSTWKVAFSGMPLFIAKNSSGIAQQIVSPPEVVGHPNGGQLVLFGSGKFIETSDITNRASQSFYGIWDRNNNTQVGQSTGGRDADLLKQELSDTPCNPSASSPANVPCATVTAQGRFRKATAKSINWRKAATVSSPANCTPAATCGASHLGWYIDLPTPKERTTGIPKIINNAIFFNTLIPSDIPCDEGGSGWLFALDFLTGGQLTTRAVFDTDGGGFAGTEEKVAALHVGATIGGTTLIQNPQGGYRPDAGGDSNNGSGSGGNDGTGESGTGATNNEGASNVGLGVTSSNMGNTKSTLIDFGVEEKGRQSWREITN